MKMSAIVDRESWQLEFAPQVAALPFGGFQ
jgi:hypothetical protein